MAINGRGVEAAPYPPSTSRFHQIRHMNEQQHVLMHQLLQRHGDFLRWRGFHDVYILNHPDFIRSVLSRDHRHFSKHIIDYRVLAQILGKGLVTNDGSHWVRQRGLIQPMFTHRRVNGFDNEINAQTRSLMDEWETKVGGDTLLLDREMSRLTFAIVGATLFGADLERYVDEVADILDTINLDPMEPRALMTLFPWIPTPHNLKWRRAMGRLDEIVYGMIEARRRHGAGDKDILDCLIHARDDDAAEGMDDRQVRDEVMTLMLAGHETSATGLAWTLYLLGTHPDIEARLTESLTTALNGAAADADDLPRLPYLKQVVQESMRIYPPVWAYARRAERAEVFNGCLLPAKANVVIAPYTLHRHTEFWPDPERFDPERFHPSRGEGRHPYSYLPFAAGPRTCIGAGMAMLEIQLVLAQILQRFRVHIVPHHPIGTISKVTLKARHGIAVTLSRR